MAQAQLIDSETFFTQAEIMLLALDLDGTICRAAASYTRLLGYKAGALVGKPLVSILDPYSHDKAKLMIARTLERGCVADWELNHVHVNQKQLLIGYSTTLLRDAHGAVVGIGAVGRDLSATVDLTSQLVQTNQQLEGALLRLELAHAELQKTQAQLVHSEKLRALGQLVAGIVHEINNPATFVAGNLDHLAHLLPALQRVFAAYQPLKALAGAVQQATISAIEAEADLQFLWQDIQELTEESREGMERIRNIVLSLSTFARLDEAVFQKADLNEGLRSTLRLVQPMCKERITITTTYGTLPLVDCQLSHLNQVFLNLLTNAIQSIPATGAITVTSTLVDQVVRISIRDTGRGMDSATLTRLGEPFFTTKPVGEGVGLGLAISMGIIEQHRGRMMFDSQPDVGTTVTIELPVTYA